MYQVIELLLQSVLWPEASSAPGHQRVIGTPSYYYELLHQPFGVECMHLVAPFWPKELPVKRTTEATSSEPAGYRVDDLLVDLGRHRVTRGEAEIVLPGLSFDLLLVLVRTAPNLLTYDQLMERVWAGVVVNPETISQRVKLVRDALGDDPHVPRYIGGVRGQGYRMLSAVEPLFTPAPVTTTATPPTATTPALPLPDGTSASTARPRLRIAAVTTIGVAALLAVGVAVITRWRAHETSQGGTGERTAILVQPSRTIAVLPFVNISGDPENEYFSDGLTEELLNRLTAVPELHVAARTSSFHFKGKNEPVRTIGQMLGVRQLLEGSVRKQGDHIRVTAQLVSAEDGYELWSHSYDRRLADVFQVQDEIALAVVGELAVTLREDARAALVHHSTTSVEALDLYLQARHFYLSFQLDRMDKAISYYKEAIRIDPGFAAAYVGLADALTNRLQIAELPVNDTNTAPIMAFLQKAIALDPQDGNAHAVLCGLLISRYDLAGAAREQQLAERLSPNSEYVLLYSAQFFGFVGSPAEKALGYARQGSRLDPLNPWALLQVPIAHYHAHQYEAARAEVDKVIELDPGFWVGPWVKAFILDALGQYEQSLAAATKAVELNDYSDTRSILAVAYARVGRQQEARATLAALDRPRGGKYSSPTFMAMALVALDDRNAALAALERAYDERDLQLPAAVHFHIFVPLHGEPRFQQLVRLLHQESRVHEAALANRGVTTSRASQ